MTQAKSSATADIPMLAFVTYITVMGAAVRLIIPIASQAPLNDGGLFYAMITDIQNNGFALPIYTSYNSTLIPFAYPPLALYVAATLSSVFQWSVFDIVRILPPVVSALTIPAFFLVAKEILPPKAQVAISVGIFAFIPRALDWLIMGGGITRSFGLLLALLAIHRLYLLFATQSNHHLPLTILFTTLVVYTHPEASVHTAITAVVFYLLKDRSIKGFGRAVAVGVATLLLTAPWWATILSRFGFGVMTAPLSAAGQDSIGLLKRLWLLLGFEFTDELFLNVVSILGLIGLTVSLVKKDYFLPLWLVTSFIIEPRGGSLYILIPHALLAAIAVDELLLAGLRNIQLTRKPEVSVESSSSPWIQDLLGTNISKITLGYILIYSILSAYAASLVISQKYTLKQSDLEAFEWARKNTAIDSQFILLTGESGLRDSSSEWFPALTQRQSLGTVFGLEWVSDGLFAMRKAEYDALQSCSNRDITCLLEWSERRGETFEYVYVRRFVEDNPVEPTIIKSLFLSEEYEQVYESKVVVIFQHLESDP